MESAGIVSGKSVFGVLRASKPSCGFLRESGVVTSKVPFFGGKFGSCDGIRDLCGVLRSGFGDDGHVRYYSDGRARCVVEGGNRMKMKKEEEGKVDEGKIVKKRMKLLDGLSRDLAMFIEMDFGVDDQGKKILESAATLLKHLELLKAEEKELKGRKKEEKAELKAERMKDMIESKPSSSSSSSSSSESSDNDCDEVVDMKRLKGSCTKQLLEEPQQTTMQKRVTGETSSTNFPMAEEKSMSCGSAQLLSDNIVQLAPTTTRVEVCMGNKCKKSGSMALLEEFERVLGMEGAVVGCKCLGKCRDGPNVRVLNFSDINQAESAVLDDSVRTPTNPLCIGVGLEDVGVIVANFLVKDQDLGLNAATA